MARPTPASAWSVPRRGEGEGDPDCPTGTIGVKNEDGVANYFPLTEVYRGEKMPSSGVGEAREKEGHFSDSLCARSYLGLTSALTVESLTSLVYPSRQGKYEPLNYCFMR